MKTRHVLTLAGLVAASTAQAIEVSHMPECPGPDVPAGILVSVTDLPIVGLTTVFRVGHRITVVLDGRGVLVPGAAQIRLVPFGKLPVGEYEVLVYRHDLDRSPAGPLTYQGTWPLSVTVAAEGTPACAPATITTRRGAFRGIL